jgi:uncharacterized protein YqjF (DUF2071 family)
MPGAVLLADIEITAPPTQPPSDSLDSWLVERYRLFVESTNGSILAAEVEHPPWRVSRAQLSAAQDSLSHGLGLALPIEPALAHCSPGVTTRFNAFRSAKPQYRS